MFNYIFPQSFMTTYTGGPSPVTRQVGTLAGKGLKIMNFTNYDVSVLAGTDLVDYVPAYQFLVLANTPDLSLQLAGTASTDYHYPNPYVAVKTTEKELAYELGSLIHFTAMAEGATVSSNITNPSVPTDLGQGLTRDTGGGLFYAMLNGITAVTFSRRMNQIYLENQSGNAIQITGDEDPTMSSQGYLLQGGGAVGLAWDTANIYMKATGQDTLPIQVQGWY